MFSAVLELMEISRDLVIILLTSFIGGAIAKKLKFPVIVGYALSGIFAGSVIRGFMPISQEINGIAEIGVALLLFTVGLEFNVSRLREMSEVIFLGSLVQVLLTVLFAVVIFPFFGMNFYTSLFLGSVFSLSSTAAVLKILSDKGELETLHGEISAGWLFMQDLYTLPLFILLPAIGKIMLGTFGGLEPAVVFGKSLIIALGAFIGVLFVGKRTVPWIFGKIANLGSRELVLTAAVGICLSFAYAFEQAGLSYAMGAFVAGVLLASSTAHHGIFAEVRPLRDIFATVFFVSLGFLVTPEFFLENWVTILLVTILVIGIKFIISMVLVLLLGYHIKTAILVGFSLISIGEFAFILALIGISSKLISEYVFLLILSVSFATLIISMLILTLSDRLYYLMRRYTGSLFPLKKYVSPINAMPFPYDHSLNKHVVVLGHGRVGKHICSALLSADIPFIVVDYNHVLVEKLKNSGIHVIYGDPAEVDVLKFARVEDAKIIILAYADRHSQESVIVNALTLNPDIRIICRTHAEEDRKKLTSLGVHAVIQPEHEAALSMTKILLQMLGTDEHTLYEKMRNIQAAD